MAQPSMPLSSPVSESVLTSAQPPSVVASSASGTPSSSLLFFVALAFGVVFTNLWIIVGVKYCFRYNQRIWQLRQSGGQPIDLPNINRPMRRRREKRLLTIEEVDQRFPVQTYKAWRLDREQAGLNSAGGITSPPNRSSKLLAPVSDHAPDTSARTSESPSLPPGNETSMYTMLEKSSITPPPVGSIKVSPPLPPPPRPDAASPATNNDDHNSYHDDNNHHHLNDQDHDDDDDDDDEEEDEDEDEEEPSGSAPIFADSSPGDTCAICLDLLDEDDNVRGLTCGHAFHASCVDPWLTSRQACCPLCKTDYIISKPRPSNLPDAPTSPRSPMGVSIQPETTAGPSHMLMFPHRFFRGFYRNTPRTFLTTSADASSPPWATSTPQQPSPSTTTQLPAIATTTPSSRPALPVRLIARAQGSRPAMRWNFMRRRDVQSTRRTADLESGRLELQPAAVS